MTGLRRELRIARLADQLSERDEQLLREVVLRRLISGTQLRELFFWEYSQQATATRRAQAALVRLVRLGLLARLDRRVGGARSGSSGFIYEGTPEGQRVVELVSAEGVSSKRHRQSLEPGRSFVAHTLATTQLYVDLVVAERRGHLSLTAEQPEPACWRQFVGPFGTPDTLRPDAFVVTKRAGSEQWSFVEVDRGTEGSAALMRKCETYLRYFQTGTEQAAYGRFPTVVWLVDRARRIEVLRRVIEETGQHRELFRVGLLDQAVNVLTPEQGPRAGGSE